MDSDRLNRWLTLVANAAVIAGIVFLALELRQNTEMMRAQSRTDMSQSAIQLMTLNINDKDYIRTMLRGFQGEELDEIENEQLHRTLIAWTEYWDNVAYLHTVGLYDDNEFLQHMSVVRDELEYLPGWKAHWCEMRLWNASEALIEVIEGGLDSDFCGE
jgi:hypothetical protein